MTISRFYIVKLIICIFQSNLKRNNTSYQEINELRLDIRTYYVIIYDLNKFNSN